MSALEATLQKRVEADPAAVDDPETRLLARVALAEREFEEGKFSPASDVVSELYTVANRA